MAIEPKANGEGSEAGRESRIHASQVPVVPISKTFLGLKVRMLADRDAGVVVWESYLLDDTDTVTAIESTRLGTAQLIHLEEIIDLLLEAREELTPRRRLDLQPLDEPEVSVPKSVRRVGGQ